MELYRHMQENGLSYTQLKEVFIQKLIREGIPYKDTTFIFNAIYDKHGGIGIRELKLHISTNPTSTLYSFINKYSGNPIYFYTKRK